MKTKTETDPEWVEVSGTQWEFARDLRNDSEDQEYWFCIVRGAGKPSAEIELMKNPIEQWKRGERHAHPINLKIKRTSHSEPETHERENAAPP